MESRVPAAAKEQALQLMKELDAEFEIEINLRSFIKAARICAMGLRLRSRISMVFKVNGYKKKISNPKNARMFIH